MPNIDQVATWVDGYVRAWNSNSPGDIAALFTEDAHYFTAPFRTPWRGTGEIVEGWLERKEEPGDATFSWEPLVLTPELTIIQGMTTYRTPPQIFSNLWIIRLDHDGRCREFTEWWMEHDS